MRRTLGWCLAGFIGFLSLGEEILWVRLVTFVYQGIPQSFAFVLGAFLLGVAAGAAAGKRFCLKWPATPARAAGLCLVAGGGLGLAIPYLAESLSELEPLPLWLGGLIFLASALKATAFPVAHHLASDVAGARVGRSISVVYFLNIAGSTLGALVAGYVLLEHFSLGGCFVLLGTATLAVGVLALLPPNPRLVPLVLGVAGVVALSVDLHDHRIVSAFGSHGFRKIKAIVENRHGILHVADGGSKGDITYGGNVYDGRSNIDLGVNSNRIDRVYLLAALHPQPKRVLVIGLSTGAWVRVLSSFPTVERMDVVELNPGYLSLIERYPHLAPVLTDPRITIHIDDGRRWLRRNPDETFDLIVMNTTFHWRANLTNLLSQEFLGMARTHLREGGVLAFNATGSPDALATASAVFPFAYRWSNFVYAADHDLARIASDAVARMVRLSLDGKPLFDLGRAADRELLERLVNTPFVRRDDVEVEAGRPLEVITDANMLTEFRYGKPLWWFR
ncbi:MAG: hypothetical protein H3C26_08570 [Rhodocyclaceae bacterium]|nr:hypothetical protein [Rhodocyclaceae bacterium]